MKATEARELAYKTNVDETDSQYSKIKAKIILEAKRGGYEMHWIGLINRDVRNKLLEEEYILGESNHDQCDGSITKISW